MNVNKAELQTVCGITSKLPVNVLPEFAFAGRSNVGKSSLINALTGRRALARTSSQPGKTQTINFYLLNEALYFVDLPGYGYAKVTKELVAKWGRMIERYLVTSKQLRRIFLLVDIRHEPSDNDKAMYAWIVDRGLQPAVIATKLDKINRSQISKQLAMIRRSLGMSADDILMPCSALTKQGIAEIWGLMESTLAPKSAAEEEPTADEQPAAEEQTAVVTD